jgi:hypothetical protein
MRGFKERLLVQEAAEMSEMAARWMDVEHALSGQIEALTYEMDERRREGKAITDAALYRLERYKRLHAQAEDEFAQYGQWADGRITREQGTLARQGLMDAESAIQISYFPGVAAAFDRLPIEAVEYLIGLAGDGRPIGDLLKRRLSFNPRVDKSSAEVWARLVDSLLQGTAQGWNRARRRGKWRTISQEAWGKR